MRQEATRYGTRVHYTNGEVPALIAEAKEMFWEPCYGWKAWLTYGNVPDELHVLRFRVHWKTVFIGTDQDIERLLDAFQRFIDTNINDVDRPGFRVHRHAPPRP